MQIGDLARELFDNRSLPEDQVTDVLREFLVYRAAETDAEIMNRLLKTLVLDYSRAERKLAELNQLKNKFLGIAAHDLRNPLTSITGFCEILLDEEETLTDDQREMITIIGDAGQNMLSLVNDLLDVSAIESGKLELRPETGYIGDVLRERLRLIEISAGKKNISLSVSLSDVPETLFDRDRMTQVIDNLLSNAVKYSPEGSTVYVTLSKEGDSVRIDVRDEGPGISDGDRQKLFGEFQKLSARPTGGEKSTGLGLSIAKKIVESHHGEILVESAPGAGSTFSIVLPLKR